MIKNELSNHLNNFFNNRNKKNEAAGNTSSDLMSRLMKNKQKQAGKDTAADTAQAQQSPAGAAPKRRNFVDEYEKSKEPKSAQAADKDTVELSAAEKRQASLKKIMDKLDAEEAARYPNRTNSGKTDSTKKTETTATSEVVTTSDPREVSEKEGIGALLNDLPLFNEFKTSLMDAFRRMDSTTAGSISAQYEVNYSSMQYIADAAGNYQYQETSFSLKLDLNYVKAGAGGMSGSEIADALGNAEDFESFVAALQSVAGQAQGQTAEGGEGEAAAAAGANNPLEGYLDSNGKPLSAKQLMNNAFKNMSPTDVLNGLQDYFSPEKTAGRIVDFATAFFPMSEAYKKGGDTEESRREFAEMMRKAVNKGFDQAQGALGAVPKETQSGIDKTHELAMKGFDDFIKNGMNKEKQDNGVYNNLNQFAMSFEMSYSQKTVSVSGYGSRGQAQTAPKASSLNAEA